MKRLSHALALMLAVVLCMGLLVPAMAEDTPDYLNTEGFPIVKEPITLTALVVLDPVQPDWSEMACWKAYEELTGIHIEWICLDKASATEKRSLMLADGKDLPDIFFRANLSEVETLRYGQEKLFLDLNEGLLQKYAPNFMKIMEEYTEVARFIPTVDGHIYALPSLSDTEPQEFNQKIFINQMWLDTLGLDMPKTTDDLYEVLKAFKEYDFNGNGQADEIPLASESVSQLIRPLRGAWGLGTRGYGVEDFDIAPDGSFRFIPTSEEYKEMLEYLNKLYTEGLIDPEIFTSSKKNLLAMNEQGMLGMFTCINVSAVANKNAENFVGLDAALIGPHGDQLFSAVRSHVTSTKTAFQITKDCKYPEAAMRWADYLYSEEGVRLLFMGVEGENYVQKEDGSYEMIGIEVPDGSSYDQVVSMITPYCGGGLPSISNEKVFKGAEMQPASVEATRKLAPYKPTELWVAFPFTLEEIDQRAQLESDLKSYIKLSTAEFIQGKRSISEFDDYVKTCENMGLAEYVALYKKAYERTME